ncbi:M61 family metallopeptidase, partial [Acinetobacter baumannii]|uniref:M61 family metallopeptidase n=1 Tax=Acinetobacter baumannii TaxID=470 RepID=UPI0028545D0A
ILNKLSHLLGALAAALALACAPARADAPAIAAGAFAGVMRLAVDATDVDRQIFRVRQTIPVQGAGPLTLLYPQWEVGS